MSKPNPLQRGDSVAFMREVVRRCGNDKRVRDMRGVVTCVKGAVAEVDTLGTYSSDDGRSIRSIPLHNLRKVTA